MEERFDILDENGNYTGRIESRKICHKSGLYHKAVAVWIINSKGSEVKWMDKDEIIERVKNNYDGITNKEGCWEYLVKYYEWLDNK